MLETYPALPANGTAFLKSYSLLIPCISMDDELLLDQFLLAEGTSILLSMLCDRQHFPQLQRVIIDSS